jgi:hypothetical protein
MGTESIEHYLKWRSIGQMLIEYDGVVVLHRTLFFLVPDAAFAKAGRDLLSSRTFWAV